MPIRTTCFHVTWFVPFKVAATGTIDLLLNFNKQGTPLNIPPTAYR